MFPWKLTNEYAAQGQGCNQHHWKLCLISFFAFLHTPALWLAWGAGKSNARMVQPIYSTFTTQGHVAFDYWCFCMVPFIHTLQFPSPCPTKAFFAKGQITFLLNYQVLDMDFRAEPCHSIVQHLQLQFR